MWKTYGFSRKFIYIYICIHNIHIRVSHIFSFLFTLGYPNSPRKLTITGLAPVPEVWGLSSQRTGEFKISPFFSRTSMMFNIGIGYVHSIFFIAIIFITRGYMSNIHCNWWESHGGWDDMGWHGMTIAVRSTSSWLTNWIAWGRAFQISGMLPIRQFWW